MTAPENVVPAKIVEEDDSDYDEIDITKCDVCDNLAVWRCKTCKVAIYCSQECQMKAWIGTEEIMAHVDECNELATTAKEEGEHIGPYSDAQRRLIYAHKGHITKGGHARGSRGGKFKWPSAAHVKSYKKKGRH